MLRALAVLILLALGGCEPRGDSENCCTVTLDVTVPEETPTVYLAASLVELGPWKPDGLALEGDGIQRRASVSVPAGTTLEYKFTLGSWDRTALSESGTEMDNFRLEVRGDRRQAHALTGFRKDPLDYLADWRESGIHGSLVYWPDVESEFLEYPRHVTVWLPDGYESGTQRYPVLYMTDGQNLFDPRIANTGIDWGVDESITRLAEAGRIRPPIVVAAWSSASRVTDYSPWHDAPSYARFLIAEIKPRVDREFRTLDGPGNTFAMGSSMGGLLSFYLVSEHSRVFGACGCLSSHFPFSAKMAANWRGEKTGRPDATPYILRDIKSGRTVPPQTRYWFDYGGKGLDASYGPTHRAVRRWLRSQGLVEERDFVVRRYPGADHNEAAWRARLDDPMEYLFGLADQGQQ